MFTKNEGSLDRGLRVALGLALLVWFVLDQGTGFWHYAKLVGVVPILTALVGWCPLYTLLGISTCPVNRA